MIMYNITYYNVWYNTPSPPIKSLDFRGFDSSRLLILRGGGILMSVEFYRESSGKFDSRTLSRETLNWWTCVYIYIYICIERER